MNIFQNLASIRSKRSDSYNKIIGLIWKLFVVGIASIVAIFVYLSFQNLPTFEQLENPNSQLASIVYASDGEELGRYFEENRVLVPYDSLSPHLVNALVSTEDVRFYDHSGIDYRAILRVIGRTVLLRDKSAGGGSTISQQLAKLLYSNRNFKGMGNLRKSLNLTTIKLKEWLTAVKLERSYTKEEILSMYLNKAEFVNGAFGIKAAAETYFAKSQDSLKIEEAAMLIGMLQNPSLYNPIKRPERTMARRNTVLSQMVKAGKLTRAEYDKLKVLPIDMSRFKTSVVVNGVAPYFRTELQKQLKDILSRQENLKPDGEAYDIYTDGLKIYTTIDLKIQNLAEKAVWDHMQTLQKKYWSVWKGRDPWTQGDSKVPVSTRQKILLKQLRETERYVKLYEKYLNPIVAEISESQNNEEINNEDIEYVMDELKGSEAILDKNKKLSFELKSKYRNILNNNKWDKLKKQWNILQSTANREFKTPVKMTVFAYNAQHMKDTIMSPLDSLRYHRMILQAGMLAVDPSTGHVKAWVGGVDHNYFQYDHVTSFRQVGSTFKPFVYATAIELRGLSPCQPILDAPYTIRVGDGNFNVGADWTPSNAEGGFSYKNYTLKEGLRQSKNSISVALMKEYIGSTKPVRGLINNMGIDSSGRRTDGTYRIPDQPSICLGAADLSVFEMTGAYTTFANGGLYNKPIFISRIEDKNGRTIFQELPLEHTALSPDATYAMVELLKYAAAGAGGMGDLRSEIGGKTGTTNDYVDGWFMGITPGIVVGTWVGGEDRWIRFTSLADGQGSKMARPIFASFLRKLENDKSVGYDVNLRFKKPEQMRITLDCSAYANTDAPAETNQNQTEDEFSDDIFNKKDKTPPQSTTPNQKQPIKKKDDEDEFN